MTFSVTPRAYSAGVSGSMNDWVLIIDDQDKGYGMPAQVAMR
jgi:hypothetical protein